MRETHIIPTLSDFHCAGSCYLIVISNPAIGPKMGSKLIVSRVRSSAVNMQIHDMPMIPTTEHADYSTMLKGGAMTKNTDVESSRSRDDLKLDLS